MVVAPPSDEIQSEIVASSTIVTRRIEVYESDGVTLWDDINQERLLDGGVTVDYSRAERRAIDIQLDNSDRALVHDPNGGFWYDKILKPYRGVITPAGSYEVQLGEYMIDRIDEGNFPHTVKVTGRDYTKKCLLDKFPKPLTYTSGTVLEDLIRDIAANAGIFRVILPNTGITIEKDFSFDKGVTRWDAMKQIADAYGYELYFDGQGYLVMREYQDPISSPSVYIFKTGIPDGNLVSFTKSTDDTRIYNHVAVTGDSSDTSISPAFAQVFNNQASSPTNVDRMGDRLYEYSSSFITNNLQALLVALRFLKVHSLENFEFNFSSIVFPWLEGGDIIEFIDPNPAPGDPTRYLLSSINIPLNLDAMSGVAKRVTIVG